MSIIDTSALIERVSEGKAVNEDISAITLNNSERLITNGKDFYDISRVSKLKISK
jgi:hypothetical protein